MHRRTQTDGGQRRFRVRVWSIPITRKCSAHRRIFSGPTTSRCTSAHVPPASRSFSQPRTDSPHRGHEEAALPLFGSPRQGAPATASAAEVLPQRGMDLRPPPRRASRGGVPARGGSAIAILAPIVVPKKPPVCRGKAARSRGPCFLEAAMDSSASANCAKYCPNEAAPSAPTARGSANRSHLVSPAHGPPGRNMGEVRPGSFG